MRVPGREALGMAARIALVGGNEFRPGCVEMDRALLDAIGVARPRVLVVPTAAVTNPPKAASDGVSHFSALGAEASPLMVLDSATANDDGYVAPLDSADLVYLTGGDPAYLLETLAGSIFFDGLRRALARGVVVAGSSAGAMVMGEWMRFREFQPALGLIRTLAVLPHHESSDPDSVSVQLAQSTPTGTAVLGVDAMTCCFGGPDGWEVLGAGAVTVYTGGSWRRFKKGEDVLLRTSIEL
jgi:cyanophycinase